jgi:hypothetical protein
MPRAATTATAAATDTTTRTARCFGTKIQHIRGFWPSARVQELLLRPVYAKNFAASCSTVPLVRIVVGPSSLSSVFRSSSDSIVPPLGSQ